VTVRAVLFDAGDTLIRLRADSGALLLAAAGQLDVAVPPAAAAEVWGRVLAGAGTPEELARGRDLSPERHRAVWTELYVRSGAEDLAAGLSDALYGLTVDPAATLMVGDNPLTDGGAAVAGLVVVLLPAPSATGPRGLGNVLSLVDAAGT
jgi:FMN phosphatase YigB (HAD superfamily)